MPDIFRYADHRKYLRDAIKEARKKDPGLSYRTLAKHLGLAAPSHFFLVLQGKRNLGSLLLLKLSAFLKLKRRDMFYLEHMTNFNQAQTKLERDEYYLRMAGLNRRLKKRK
jgi:uncharacterized protein (TIGR02147 family)